jgi:DNA-directed RNA polymerase specialized sigma24 family protein/CheY-like chemotaxis protein
MSIANEVLLPLLPYLRRHARLLTGSRDIGDEYVRLCLELLVEEPERLADTDPRMALFNAIYASWDALNAPHSAVTEVPRSRAERVERGLAALAPLDRQVLLLIAIDNFSTEDVARLLDLDAAAIDRHLATARQALKPTLAVPVLIIEDEAVIAMELAAVIEEMSLVVAAMVARQDQAIDAVGETSPGLVLADIQLEGEGNGIEAAEAILQQYNVPVIFVTGYPERLLTGNGTEPAFVVPKPIHTDGLKAAIVQALATYEDAERAEDYRARLLAKLRGITGKDLRAPASALAQS